MLKAVLKKSREGGKGSKKETGMRVRTGWASMGVGAAGPRSGSREPVRGVMWVRMNSTYWNQTYFWTFFWKVQVECGLWTESFPRRRGRFVILTGHSNWEFDLETWRDSRCVQNLVSRKPFPFSHMQFRFICLTNCWLTGSHLLSIKFSP